MCSPAPTVRPSTRRRPPASTRQTQASRDGTTETRIVFPAPAAGLWVAPALRVFLRLRLVRCAEDSLFSRRFAEDPESLLGLSSLVIPRTKSTAMSAIASAATTAAREGGPGGVTRRRSG